MTTIEEAYCSFEVTKLLKEKGFDYQGFDYIDFEGEIIRQNRPTHQMAMRWLREVHNIFIVIEPYSNTSCYFSLWKGDDYYYENPLKKDFPSYEEAVEAALKYCLENLV